MFKFPLTFLFFLVAFLFALPHASWAQSTCQPGPGYCQCFNTQLQTHMADQAANKSQAITDVNNHLKKILASSYSCLAGIDLGFDLSGLFDNPTDFISKAAEAAFWKFLEGIADSICQAILSTITSVIDQVTAFVESIPNLACIPLPGFGASGIDLGLPQIPCNGSPVISNAIRQGVFKPGSTPLGLPAYNWLNRQVQ